MRLRDMIRHWKVSNEKEWAHDRAATVGASEIGKCIRQTWLAKKEHPADEGYDPSVGALIRGDLIENEVWVPAIREAVTDKFPGVELLHAGGDQETLFDGFLSSTSDGCIVNRSNEAVELFGVTLDPGKAMAVECKSIDPRVDLREPKPEHSIQVRVQMELIRQTYGYDVVCGVLTYIDASFFDTCHEFIIERDPAFVETMKDRARLIMKGQNAADFRPEGKMAGGKECQYCPYQAHCADATAAAIPTDEVEVDGQTLRTIENAIATRDRAAQAIDEWNQTKEAATEAIKEALRAAGTRRVKTDDFSVSYSAVKGRVTVDIKAAEAAGLDLSAFKKEGSPSDRLTIRSS